jgi:hypothetical protein
MNIEVYQRTHAGTSGSTNCVGGRFRSFEISNLKMVDLTGIVPAGDEPKARRRVPEHGQVPDD